MRLALLVRLSDIFFFNELLNLKLENFGKIIFKTYEKKAFHKETGAAAAAAKSLQSCPTLCDPIDGSLPGSSVHGIFQTRVLAWGATVVCIS